MLCAAQNALPELRAELSGRPTAELKTLRLLQGRFLLLEGPWQLLASGNLRRFRRFQLFVWESCLLEAQGQRRNGFGTSGFRGFKCLRLGLQAGRLRRGSF